MSVFRTIKNIYNRVPFVATPEEDSESQGGHARLKKGHCYFQPNPVTVLKSTALLSSLFHVTRSLNCLNKIKLATFLKTERAKTLVVLMSEKLSECQKHIHLMLNV